MSRRSASNGRQGDAFDSSGEWKDLESQIRGASRYVVPSDNLRPKIMEAAREQQSDRRNNHLMLRYAFVGCLVAVFFIAIVDQISAWRETPSNSSVMVQKRALELSAENRTSVDWGLFEAFEEVRTKNASKLGHPKELGSIVPGL